MRRLLACALLLVSCSGMDPSRPPEAAPASPVPFAGDPAKRAAVERDLALVLTRSGTGELDADDEWPITATLVNRGKSAHWIVKPDDGSGVGWREPTVYYSAEMETTPGVWQPVPNRDDRTRCAMYARDWTRDVAELASGETASLLDFMDASWQFDFSRSGTIRLYAHYEYDAGQRRSHRSSYEPERLPRELVEVGPFALVSAPLEVRVHVDTSAELRLVLRRARVRAGEKLRIAALGDASIASRSDARLDLGEDFPDSRFHLDVEEEGRLASVEALDGPRDLAPRERVSLHPTAFEHDFAIERLGTMRLRLRFDAAQTRNGVSTIRRYRSPWVEVEVVP